MKKKITIAFEPLLECHRKDVIDILNYYISSTTAAFRDKAVDYDHFSNFLDKDNVYLGYAIKDDSNLVIGFCTIEPFKNMQPFKMTAEVMYFIKKEYIGKGIGTSVLGKLEDDAKRLGVKKLIVDITDDNDISISFHKKNGFREYGRLKKCWKKFEKDLGIVYMEKDI
ncbi:MAG: N-acetyltransferase family protein [Sphingobacteriia bacterium]|nr:N-acetyltransferase family protein [Sphingobacteriia bacterium]